MQRISTLCKSVLVFMPIMFTIMGAGKIVSLISVCQLESEWVLHSTAPPSIKVYEECVCS